MTSMLRRIPIVSLALLLGCGNKAETVDVSSARKDEGPVTAPAPAERISQQPSAQASADTWAQKLIRTAEMRVQVKDVKTAVNTIDTIARNRGGMLADSKTSDDGDERQQAHVVVRVPSERFGGTIEALRKLGTVKVEAVNTADITKQYADLETRLAVKEQTVTRLRAILTDRTAKLADVLEVEREIARVVSEIEELKGERRFYDRQVAMSTITLDLFDDVAPRGTPFTQPIANAWRNSLGVLSNSLASVLYLLTFLTPWAIIAGVAWWARGRFRARARLAPASPARAE